MMIFETLYKRTSTGKIQIWYAEVEEERYRTTSGQIDGKKVVSEWTTAKPMNVGKANATTAEEQAVLKVKSMYDKQLKSKYHYNIDDVDNRLFFEPMTAKKWGDRKSKVKETHVHIQPKLDGMRCVATKDGLFSRNGEVIVSVPHISEELRHYFMRNPDNVLDGELYNHDLFDDFNKIMSLCKKTKDITDEEYAESREKIQYHVYDCYLNDESDFQERFSHIADCVSPVVCGNGIVKIVDTRFVHVDEVDSVAAEYIEMGYEGAMVRLRGKYVNKRSDTLLKWKEMQDAEFQIKGIYEGNGNKQGWAASVELLTEDGKEFNTGVIGNEEYARELFRTRDEHIGKYGTVIFQNYTPDGIPRFGKFKAVRDYE